MFRFLRKHRNIVFIFLAVIIVSVLLFNVGAPSFHSSPNDVIARINDEKITFQDYNLLYAQIMRVKKDITEEQKKNLPQEVFHELIRQKVFNQEAEKFGIHITDKELQLYLASMPGFQKNGQFDPQTYYQTVVGVFRMTRDHFEESRKMDLADQKLRHAIASAINIPNADFQTAFEQRLKIETDAKKKKSYQENPELFKNELRNEEMNIVFADWLSQINSKLKVSIISEQFKKQLSGQS